MQCWVVREKLGIELLKNDFFVSHTPLLIIESMNRGYKEKNSDNQGIEVLAFNLVDQTGIEPATSNLRS